MTINEMCDKLQQLKLIHGNDMPIGYYRYNGGDDVFEAIDDIYVDDIEGAIVIR